MQAGYGAPQSGFSWVPTRSEHAEGNTVHPVRAREGRPGGVEAPWHARKHCVRDPGGPALWPGPSQPGPHGEPTREHGCDARVQGVGPLHSTNEATEQRARAHEDENSHGGGRGGKGAGQGEDGRANQGPDTVPECPATCARPETTGSAAGPREAADGALAPCRRHQPLREAYDGLNREAAPGVDGQTWAAYGEHLEANLRDLSDRLKRGAYHARPVERVYIPKPDGRQRPIGIPTLEDTIVQRATVAVLNAIYEGEFRGFSSGLRPGRSPHDALDAVTVGIEKRHVNWVLDADIRGCFDAIDHAWLVQCIEHRIGDQRVVRHRQKWLHAGVLEEGQWHAQEEGTPQGGSVSPLAAHISLHDVLDLWADRWRRQYARGDVIIVRYADDCHRGLRTPGRRRTVLERTAGTYGTVQSGAAS